MRERFFDVIWKLLWPIRLYLRHFPYPRGKGILLRYLVVPLLPPEGVEFLLPVPSGGSVRVGYRETIGLSSLLHGTFEKGELEFVSHYLHPGNNVMDIGANIGLFAVVMGRAIGQTGVVMAFDPVPGNIWRLKSNLSGNGISSEAVYELALGSANERLDLKMSDDTAYASIHTVEHGLGNGRVIQVDVRRLDDVWHERGCPVISFVKMDVEGAELEVIRGGVEMLSRCHPTMLIEANTSQHLAKLNEALRPFGYRHIHPGGFVQHNHLFICPAQVQETRG
jgi:FkbM family methyltransferase